MTEVKKIFSMYNNSGTKNNIKRAVTQFFKTVYPEEKFDSLEETNRKYFSEERDHEEDILKFLKSLNSLAPLTIKLRISNIKTFFIENDVELSQKFWKKIKRLIKGSRALTLDRIPTKAEFKKILMHMDIHGKALYLTLESSGMRIGELLKSNIDDLYLEEKPLRIQIRGENTKSGNSRHAFISSEAKEALTEWLKVRKEYLRVAVAKSHLYEKSLDDSRIFPFASKTAYSIWTKALHKSRLNGRDKSTNREKLHPHVLRKFFRTRLGAAGIQIDVVEALMGHEGYLTEVYRKYTVEDLAKFYLKGEHALLVFTDTQKVVELHKAIEEKNTQLQVLVNSLASENQNMKGKVAKFETENLEMKSKIARVELESTEAKKEMCELSLTVKSLIEKMEKLTQS